MNRIFILFFVTGLLVSACQKVIEIPLNTADQTLVVDIILKDDLGDNYGILSKTGSVYQQGDFERIIDGSIKITKEDGTVVYLGHQEDGFYRAMEFQVEPGKWYDLEVQAFDRTITASSYAPVKPKIDSLSYFTITGSFGIPIDDTLNIISFHAVDNPDEKNYYWAKIFINGIENNGYYWGNDDFINGQYFEAQFFGDLAEKGDTVLVELISVDKANYDYIVGLSNNLNSNNFSAAPANPPSNLIGDAVGFFGAFSSDTMSFVVPL
jgi:hypothetical protein